MLVGEHFFLTKKKFVESSTGLLRGLLSDDDFTDVTLTCSDTTLTCSDSTLTCSESTLTCSDTTQVRAHRAVLSNTSKFFKDVLRVNRGPNLVIYLKGVKHRDLCSLMEFIYCGKTRVSKVRTSSTMCLSRRTRRISLTI